MDKYQLAQINIAQLIAPQGHPLVSEFFDNVPRINELAEASPGFIWRFTGEYPDPMIAFNMSVWESTEALTQFVYRSGHVEIFRRKGEWFHPMSTSHTCMWWIESGHFPSAEEGLAKLKLLDTQGPSQSAFTFAQRFPTPR